MAERAKANRDSKRGGKRKTKGNGAAASAAPPIGHNSDVPDEVYQRWLPKIKDARAGYEKAAETARQKKSALAKVYQSAEADGCNRAGITEALSMMREDPINVVTRVRTIDRVLRLENSILHEQYELRFDGRIPEVANPFLLGQQCGREAGPREPPYKPGSSEFELWLEGYDAGQKQNMESLRQASGAQLN
jgi:hypothetical protein